ncbi:MAG: hypothetical protein HRU00_03995 [Myxococcales bacterium]|nr:hypothetical protein [Myxococcales bacterium]
MSAAAPGAPRTGTVRAAIIPRLGELWSLLLGPLLILFVYLAYYLGWDWVQSKGLHELIALVLTPIALLLFAWTAFETRDPLQQVLTGLSAVFLMREIHLYDYNPPTYVALVLAAIWIWRWRYRLVAPFLRPGTRSLVYGALFTYLLSQLLDRRALRILPYEQSIRLGAEEMMENLGHLLWIATALVTRRVLRRERPPTPAASPD